jgi:hypothetical protein
MKKSKAERLNWPSIKQSYLDNQKAFQHLEGKRVSEEELNKYKNYKKLIC